MSASRTETDADGAIPVRNDKGGTGLRRLDPSRPVMSALIDRRRLLAGVAGLAAAGLMRPTDAMAADLPTFDPPVGPDDAWLPGWSRQVVIRWGDPLQPGVETPQSLLHMTASEADVRFGYNNDYLAYFPLPEHAGADEAGLLAVNHEYPTLHMMFPGITAGDGPDGLSDDQIAASLSSVGISIVSLERQGENWNVVTDARARRVTARTPIRLSGPAAGHPRLRTSADPRRADSAGDTRQLQRRHDAVGHVPVGRGGIQRLLRRQYRRSR